MNLANVSLLNYINMRRIGAKDPQVSTQKLVRYTGADGDGQQRVMSLTHYHWILFDTLTEQAGIEVEDLLRTAESYAKLKDVYIDQALEKTMELIAQTFDVPLSEEAQRRYGAVNSGEASKGRKIRTKSKKATSVSANENKNSDDASGQGDEFDHVDDDPFSGRKMDALVNDKPSKTLH